MSERKLNLLVTGAGGQLGQEFVHMDHDGIEIIGKNRSELDITDYESCQALCAIIKPDFIVHAAAYTAVDQAESKPEAAWAVNVEGTRNMAKAAEAVGAKFCYISTDYVFDGSGKEPYPESHPTAPQSVYGASKLEGERNALELSSKCFVVRTSWVYGKYGRNFVQTMLQLAKSKKELMVVDDQIGSPTYTYDLANFIIELVQSEKYGIYHASNSGNCSWFEFAKAIFEDAGISSAVIHPCSTEQFPRPAPRPAYSVLGQQALIKAGFTPLRPWREALRDYLSEHTASYIFPDHP
ncbi:dTDP-4-dehydrorhamnose reductase [Cohnella phaseoli]|uniref:dTDP-4-dehydrorhamnose reductase n=1 Tax=Cohnella phaseoli TaxID=456490 RepID=A0A3D9KD07_9BACL|nr:dTDP-4-dehydrorhamnose reductase [Cohnella phaseoli]RED84020.1 dTDP-4-dehydrorhamnose reductase [Cohnella phaseoli]